MKPQFKTLRQLFDALAFANAANYGEFQELLDRMDQRAGTPAPERPRARVYSLRRANASARTALPARSNVLHK